VGRAAAGTAQKSLYAYVIPEERAGHRAAAHWPMTAQNPNELTAAPLRVRVPEHVVYRPFPHETVALNLETGKYHSLNTTAGRMLELLDQLGDTERVAERMADEYGIAMDEVRRDLLELCDDLAGRKLIVVA
jgi:hypothetical protein